MRHNEIVKKLLNLTAKQRISILKEVQTRIKNHPEEFDQSTVGRRVTKNKIGCSTPCCISGHINIVLQKRKIINVCTSLDENAYIIDPNWCENYGDFSFFAAAPSWANYKFNVAPEQAVEFLEKTIQKIRNEK